MSDILSSPYGLSVRRNGSCLNTETDCGKTWSPFHACCPSGTKCPTGQSNVKCCPSDADCSELVDNTHCANSTANVYKASGYFCCADGSSAFMRENGYVGCTEDISDLDSSMTLLSIKYHATTSISTSTPIPMTSSTLSSTPTRSTMSASLKAVSEPNSNNSPSSANTGEIIGGVVGGVAGLAIIAGLLCFFIRKRSRKIATVATERVATQPGAGSGLRVPGTNIVEYFVTPGRGSDPNPPRELDGQPKNGPHELPSQLEYR